MKTYSQEVASELTNLVNSFSIDYDAVTQSLSHEHRTLQQNFTRLCFAWIKRVATDPNYGTDDRNRATYVKCKAIYDTMSTDPAWDFLPMI